MTRKHIVATCIGGGLEATAMAEADLGWKHPKSATPSTWCWYNLHQLTSWMNRGGGSIGCPEGGWSLLSPRTQLEQTFKQKSLSLLSLLLWWRLLMKRKRAENKERERELWWRRAPQDAHIGHPLTSSEDSNPTYLKKHVSFAAIHSKRTWKEHIESKLEIGTLTFHRKPQRNVIDKENLQKHAYSIENAHFHVGFWAFDQSLYLLLIVKELLVFWTSFWAESQMIG